MSNVKFETNIPRGWTILMDAESPTDKATAEALLPFLNASYSNVEWGIYRVIKVNPSAWPGESEQKVADALCYKFTGKYEPKDREQPTEAGGKFWHMMVGHVNGMRMYRELAEKAAKEAEAGKCQG